MPVDPMRRPKPINVNGSWIWLCPCGEFFSHAMRDVIAKASQVHADQCPQAIPVRNDDPIAALVNSAIRP